jgi:uncharacterized repeat protein (TIGR01451 family)
MLKVARRGSQILALGALLATILTLGAVQSASAATATISSSGPLTSVGISTDLNCSVNHTGDTDGEFFGDTACGTLVAMGGVLYGPAAIPAGGAATPRTTYTEVSQTAVTGTGSTTDPFTIVTVDDLGSTGVRLTETDSYVVGQEAYLTQVSLNNTSGTAQNAIIYRAGDCFLQNSDSGLGEVDGAAVACKANTGDRIEQWFPITAGSSYMEAGFGTVWAQIGSQQPFANTCLCTDDIDNGAGLSWSEALGAGATSEVQQYTTFSPLGIQPLTVTKTADAPTIAPGGADGYTISVANPGSAAVSLQSVVDSLPAGFSYRTGTTTGGITAEPTVSGQTVTWNGPIAIAAGGTLTFHFNVTGSSTAGTYTNSADATGAGLLIIGAHDVAPVVVSGTATTAAPTTAAPAVATAAAPEFTG